MGIGSPPKAPNIPLPPPAAHPPVLGSGSSIDAALRSQRAATAATTFDNTLATSPQGLLKKPSVAKSTLLGQ